MTQVPDLVIVEPTVPYVCKFDVPHFFYHLSHVSDKDWIRVIKYSSLPYMWKALGMKNMEEEAAQRIGYVFLNFDKDKRKFSEAKYFFSYLLLEPFGFQPEKMQPIFNRMGVKVMTNVDKLLKQSLKNGAIAMVRAEGREEGRAEACEAIQSHLFETINNRFTEVSQAICEQIRQVRDYDILNRLVTSAFTAKNREAFEQDASMALAGK